MVDRLLVSVQQPELNRHVVARRRVVGIQLHGLRIGLDSALQRLHAVRVVRALEVVALTFSQAVGVLEREFGVATPLVVLEQVAVGDGDLHVGERELRGSSRTASRKKSMACWYSARSWRLRPSA